jgi:hypothetical protein
MKKVAATKGHKVSFPDFRRDVEGAGISGRVELVAIDNSYGCLLDFSET